MSLIEISDLYYSYPGFEAKVLKGITVNIDKGSFTGIVGPCGAGKTTFSLTLNGLIPHLIGGKMTGSVVVDGLNTMEHPIADLSLKIGMIFQDPRAQLSGSGLTVEEEVAFGLQNLGVPREEILERISKALIDVGLSGFEERSPFELSGGEQQRLAIATVLAMEPDIFILDEPFAQLDPMGVEEVASIVGELNKKFGKTVILVENNTEILANFADRILVMEAGKIVADGSPREIFTDIEYLENTGVIPLQVTELAHLLKKEGKWDKEYPLTEDEALKEIKRIFFW